LSLVDAETGAWKYGDLIGKSWRVLKLEIFSVRNHLLVFYYSAESIYTGLNVLVKTIEQSDGTHL
jgi:hypothetical protein